MVTEAKDTRAFNPTPIVITPEAPPKSVLNLKYGIIYAPRAGTPGGFDAYEAIECADDVTVIMGWTARGVRSVVAQGGTAEMYHRLARCLGMA